MRILPGLQAGRPRRGGFSLIELLVVIAIISVLAALAVSGTLQYIETQKQTNTETAIRSLYQVLAKHWKDVIEEAKKEPASNISPAVMALAAGDIDRARVIWVKLRLMEAFPMNFTEILSADDPTAQVVAGNALKGTAPLYYQPSPRTGSPYIPKAQRKYMLGYLKALRPLKINTAGTPPGPTEMSACLVLALQVNRGGVALDVDSLGPNAVDTNGDGLKEAVDGWRTPLAFYRFPAKNTDLQTTFNPNPNARFQDPLDPDGRLVVPAWYNDNINKYKAEFEALVHKIDPKGTAPLKGTYMVPVIASAGKDGTNYTVTTPANLYNVLGINPPPGPLSPDPMQSANNGKDFDNIYSYRLRLGARGD